MQIFFLYIFNHYTPLFFAASSGNPALINTLFDYNADLDSQGNKYHSPLNQAVQRKKIDCLEILLSRGFKPSNEGVLSPLMQAIVTGLIEAVEPLLDKGADINYENPAKKTALFQAIKRNDEDLVNFLLDRGANPRFRTQFGNTAIHVAATTGNLNIVKRVIAAGADPHSLNDKGQNACFSAISAPPEKLLELLQYFYEELEFDINQEAVDKSTILTEILPDSKRLTPEIMEFLITHGADYNKKTKVGFTVYEMIMSKAFVTPDIKEVFNVLTKKIEDEKYRKSSKH